jgi:hypothetical protein
MRRRGIINRLRGHIADTLGIRSDDAAQGKWWEVDLIIVIFGGAIVMGIAALFQF